MSSFLTSIHLSLDVIALICDLVQKVTDIKSFCLLLSACGLVYCLTRSTPDAPLGLDTLERRQQYEEWMQQDEFVSIISQAMERAAEIVARENSTLHEVSTPNTVPPVQRRR